MGSTRRKFLGQCGRCLTGMAFAPLCLHQGPAVAGPSTQTFIREAGYYRKLGDGKVQCQLCPKQCIVADGKRGYCRVRENREGVYNTLVYGRLSTIQIDPIEKKPLFHYLPGSAALSVAATGCNVKCKFCQNWNISQAKPEDVPHRYFSPEQLVETARRYGTPSIAHTYNEPVVFSEYVLDTAVCGRRSAIRNVIISNGYINPEPLAELCEQLSAIKIDLKAFTEKFYRETVNGSLQPVLDTLKYIHSRRVWLEIVYLVIPTLNDSETEIRDMSRWVMENLGPDVPVHFTRYHPQYLLKNLPPTPVGTLESAHRIATAAGIHYVYIGNVPSHAAESTYCHHCGQTLIERHGYLIGANHIIDAKCEYCQTTIPGLWS